MAHNCGAQDEYCTGCHEEEVAKLRTEVRGATDAHREAVASNDRLIHERDSLFLQNDQMRKALERCINECGCGFSAQGEYDDCRIDKMSVFAPNPCAVCAARELLGKKEKRNDQPVFLCRAATIGKGNALVPCENVMPCVAHSPCFVCGRPTGGCCTVAR